MKRYLLHVSLFLRRIACVVIDHRKIDTSIGTVGIRVCTRCYYITDQKTVRRHETKGDVEALMAKFPPQGYSFVSFNWKKRKARFVSPSGAVKFVTL